MPERIFVKVMGFSDVERHALNTIFRLSEQRDTIYSVWQLGAPEAARLGLVDGQSYEAQLEVESPNNTGMQLIWIDGTPTLEVYRHYRRPISWRQILRAMDELYAPSAPPLPDDPSETAQAAQPAVAAASDTAPEESDAIDFDLGFDIVADAAPDTGPDTLPPEPEPPAPPVLRALIASASREERLYMRARLSLSDITQADEAETGAQALEFARANHYAVALVDFGLPDVDGWAFLKELKDLRPAIPHVIVTKFHASLGERIRGRLSGAEAFFNKPPDPQRLKDLLEKVQ